MLALACLTEAAADAPTANERSLKRGKGNEGGESRTEDVKSDIASGMYGELQNFKLDLLRQLLTASCSLNGS